MADTRSHRRRPMTFEGADIYGITDPFSGLVGRSNDIPEREEKGVSRKNSLKFNSDIGRKMTFNDYGDPFAMPSSINRVGSSNSYLDYQDSLEFDDLEIPNVRSYREKHKKRAPIKKWSKEEDALLRKGILKYINANKPINYEEVALSIPGRSVKQAKERWKNSLNPTIRKGEWSNGELLSLLDLIIHKAQNWTEIQKELYNRSMHCIKSKGRKLLGETLSKRLQKKCTKFKQTSQSAKKLWTEDEDRELVELHKSYMQANNAQLLTHEPVVMEQMPTEQKLKIENIDVFEYACCDDLEVMLEGVCVGIGTGRPTAQIDRRLLNICDCRVCTVRKQHLDKMNVDFKIAWTQTKAKIVKLKLLREIRQKDTHDKRVKPKKRRSTKKSSLSSTQDCNDENDSVAVTFQEEEAHVASDDNNDFVKSEDFTRDGFREEKNSYQFIGEGSADLDEFSLDLCSPYLNPPPPAEPYGQHVKFIPKQERFNDDPYNNQSVGTGDQFFGIDGLFDDGLDMNVGPSVHLNSESSIPNWQANTIQRQSSDMSTSTTDTTYVKNELRDTDSEYSYGQDSYFSRNEAYNRVNPRELNISSLDLNISGDPLDQLFLDDFGGIRNDVEPRIIEITKEDAVGNGIGISNSTTEVPDTPCSTRTLNANIKDMNFMDFDLNAPKRERDSEPRSNYSNLGGRSRKRDSAEIPANEISDDFDFSKPVHRLRKVDYQLDSNDQKTFEALVAGALSISGLNKNTEDVAQALTISGFNFEGQDQDISLGTETEDDADGAKQVLTMVRNYTRNASGKSATTSLARKVVQAFSEYLSPNQLSTLHNMMKKNNVEWLNPKVCFMLDELNLSPDQADPRYTKDFLCPDKISFDPFRPVGTYLLDFVSKIIVDVDKDSKEIARGSMRNKHGWKYVPGKLEGLLRVYYLIPQLVATGVAWSHVTFFRCDGTKGIFLCQYKLLSKEKLICCVRFQDVSEKMQRVLTLPDLF